MKKLSIAILIIFSPFIGFPQGIVRQVTYSFDSIIQGVPLHSEYKIYSDSTYYMENINGMSGVYDTGLYKKNNGCYVFFSNEPRKIDILKIEESNEDTLRGFKILLFNAQAEKILYPEYFIINFHDTILVTNGEYVVRVQNMIKEIQYFDGDSYCGNITKLSSNKANVYKIYINTMSKSPRLRQYLDGGRISLNGRRLKIFNGYLLDELFRIKYTQQ